jgi:hypothetical protein
MDRVATLITQASELRGRIYSSIPFSERFAALFLKLALDTVETLGRILGAEMLLAGVTDMPDPGPRWRPEARNPALTLPSSYMRDLGSSIYGTLLRKFHDPDLVDEAAQRFLLKLTTTKPLKAVSRSTAESYIRDGVTKMALSIIRERRQKMRDERRNVSLDDHGPDDESRSLADSLEDPSAFEALYQEMSPRVWRLWMDTLARRLHPDIPTYISLSMQGYSDAEILGDPRKPGLHGMLPTYKSPPSGPNSFIKYVIGKIPAVSRQFFRQIHEELPLSV